MPQHELEAFIDGLVRVGMDEAHVAGVAVSIVQSGRVVLNKGYGFASFDPVQPVDSDTTLFRIGSITKTFTWIAVMRAVEAGKLDLDAPVNTYLPRDLQVPDEGFEQPIRMRDLMMHSPGFDDRAAGILFVFDPTRLMPLEEFLRNYRPRRVREPGVVTSYSNYGTALAGAVVASVENMPWQELVEREILAPLGLARTSVREPYPPRAGLPAPMADSLARDLSNAFRWNGVAHVARGFEFITQVAPAGVMSASARDMARYMLLLLGEGTFDGVRVFGPTAARAFREPLTRLPRGMGTFDGGFFETPQPGGFSGYGHDGATMSFFSSMVIVPDLDLGIFATTNTEGGGRISGALPGRVVEHFYGSMRPAPRTPAREIAESARVYEGDYLPTRRRYGGLEGFVTRLANVMSVDVTRDGYLVVTGGLGPARRFVPAGEQDVFRPAAGPDGAGGMLRFDRDGDRANRVVAMPVAFERVGLFYQRQTLVIAAGLTLFTSIAIVVGFFLRLRRELAESRSQRLARRLQLAAAVLWLACTASFALWVTSVTADLTAVFRDWPGPSLATASSAALAATVLTLLGVPLLPAVWRSPVNAAGWTPWRKGRYTVALMIFAALGILLGAWGALAPWAS